MVLPATVKTIISFALMLIGAYAVLFLISLVIWTFRDIRSRTRDVLVQILATLLVVVFNIPGLLLYFVLRPRETLTEAYEHALGQEALLQDIEERYICPNCKRKADADFLICPYCHHGLRKRCPKCGRLLSLNWDICPYCGLQQGSEQIAQSEQNEMGSEGVT
ncbi:MAG: zinc ribbon domain-containing protein [Chloroflexi bacterium]|nr:zinc ribbon domain-containing protein [Chloroflexota bacterium]